MAANSLRQIRERKGMTLQQLSGRTSISLRTLGEYEQGQRPFTTQHLRALAKALFTTPEELTRPPGPAPGPVSAPAPEAPTAPAPPPAAPAAPTPSAPPPPEAPAPVAPPLAPAPVAPVPARPGFVRPQMPASEGQLTVIRRIGGAVGLDEEALAAETGKPLPDLTRYGARQLIRKLRGRLDEAGIEFSAAMRVKPKSIREQPDHEETYLAQKRDEQAVLTFHLFGGEQFRGRILEFTPYEITIREEGTGAEMTLRKLAITYWRVDGAPAEGGAS